MGIVNEQQFIEQATTEGICVSLSSLEYSGVVASIADGQARRLIRQDARRTLLNEGQARSLYAAIREKYTSSSWLSKEIRPWTLVPSIIPEVDEPLIGFEFETSPRSSSERTRIKRELWDTFDNYSVDPEGGEAGLEVTFSPEPVSAYVSGTSRAQRFASEVLATMQLEEYHEGNCDIGTHANISIPGIPPVVVERFINNGLECMPAVGEDGTNLRLSLFGRTHLYGLAYNQTKYVEMKTFRTTYDPQVMELYIGRVVNLINGIKVATEEYGVTVLNKVCSNLYDVMMTGATPVMVDAPDMPLIDGRTGQEPYYVSRLSSENLSDLSSLEVAFSAARGGYDNDYDEDDDEDYDEEECYCDECEADRDF